MISDELLRHLSEHPDCLTADERADLRGEIGFGDSDFVRDANLIQHVFDRRSGKTTRAVELAKIVVMRLCLESSLGKEARQKVKTIICKAIVGGEINLDALATLVEAGLTLEQVENLARSEHPTLSWIAIYERACKRSQELRSGRIRYQAGRGLAEVRTDSAKRIDDLERLLAETTRGAERTRESLRAAIQERDDARSAFLELQKKFDQIVVENVQLSKKVNVRVAATCSCGRYPAGACSRCAFDDRYEARQINLDHRTPFDLAAKR